MENDNPYLREVNKLIHQIERQKTKGRCYNCKHYSSRLDVYSGFINQLENLKTEIRFIK